MARRALLTAMALVFSAPVVAAELTAFVPAEDGASACWQRVYDAAHLASHPDQQVTSMTLLVTYKIFEGAEQGLHLFGLDAALRDGRAGQTSGECSAYGGDVRCGVECDGGGLALDLRADGALLADLESFGYIRIESECGGGAEDQAFELLPGLDDRQFLLHPAEAKACKALMPR